VLENYIVPHIPLLSRASGRSLLQFMLGFFFLDRANGSFAYFTGVLLIGAGMGWLVESYIQARTQGNVASFSTASSVHSSVSKVDFGKYVDKKPAYEIKGKGVPLT
jgi:hypothetical protein